MNTTRDRRRFILGLQIAAGLMFAQQVGGKAARDGLFLMYHGPRSLPAMIAGAAIFSVALSLLSGRLLQRRAPHKVVPWSLALSAILQALEYQLLGTAPQVASILIYLHMAGVGAVLLSTFWSMLNEEFDPREAKLRFWQISAAGTVGGLLGGLAAERVVAWSGAPALLLLLAGLHLVCGIFVAALMRGASLDSAVGQDSADHLTPSVAPYRSPLLRTLGIVVLLGSLGAALLDYVFKVYASETWGDSNLVRFFAFFHMGVGALSFLLQSVGAKWTLEKFGLGRTIQFLPVTLVGGSFLALLVPGAVVVLAARIAEAAVRGSLFRAGYETCYTPVPADQKRLAKAFIDVAAERGGDALGAATVYVCLLFAGAAAVPWILSLASLVGVASVILCSAVDRIYVKALARSLESQAVHLQEPDDLDLTTRSVVIRSPVIRVAPEPVGPVEPERISNDPVLHKLNALRSGDKRQVQAALIRCDASDPLVAAQVCLLLGDDDCAPLAHTVLLRISERVLGLLTDLMMDNSLDLPVRRRIPRIIATVKGQRSVDALVYGLESSRFEVRMQCAKGLSQAAARDPRPLLRSELILAAVDRELEVGTVLWESHREQERNRDLEELDELVRVKARGSLEYVFSLLALIYDRAPVMMAYQSLNQKDRHLRGTALEYLEGILPVQTRELLWSILQERPTATRGSAEIMQELMRSSDTIFIQMRKGDRGPVRTGDPGET